MSESSPEVLETTMLGLEQLAVRLLEVLESEREALVARALTDLETITTEKATLCQKLDSMIGELGAGALREQIAALPQTSRPALEQRHARLVELTRQVQNCNAVNGKIVHRSQQSVRELMQLMGGTDTEGLYSAQGYKAQGQTSMTPGTAIARA